MEGEGLVTATRAGGDEGGDGEEEEIVGRVGESIRWCVMRGESLMAGLSRGILLCLLTILGLSCDGRVA